MIDNVSSDFFLVGQELDFSTATAKKIQDFQKLAKGWNFGEGQPFSEKIIKEAKALNKEMIENCFLETGAFPGNDGEIMVTLYYSDYYLEFTIEPNLTITFAKENKKETLEYKEDLTFDKALKLINNFREEIWSSSESFTLPTLTTKKIDSQILPSSQVAVIRESQLLIKNVFPSLVAQSVNILNTSTKRYLENPEFFGSSKNEYFQVATV